MGRFKTKSAVALAAATLGCLVGSTGCLGSFLAGALIDQAICSDLGDPRRRAHLDLSITHPETVELSWEGRTKAADCDSSAGVGDDDAVIVFFDRLDDERIVGFALGDDAQLLGSDVATSLIVDSTSTEDPYLLWAGLECLTNVTTYEDLGNGFAFIEGHGECVATAEDEGAEPTLAAEYSFGNVVLVDPWTAAVGCC